MDSGANSMPGGGIQLAREKQIPIQHLVVFLVEDPPGDAAMGPGELRPGIFLEHLLELVKMFIVVN
jgi:hypothetical protein